MRVNAHGAPTLRDNLIYENTAEGIKVSKAGGGLFTQNVRSRTAGPGRAGPDKGMCGGLWAHRTVRQLLRLGGYSDRIGLRSNRR